jgi:ammonium transporter, Amt family
MSDITTSTPAVKVNARRVTSLVFVGIVALFALFAVSRPGSQMSATLSGDVNPVNEGFVLICAAFVFFMQAGFLAYEVGLSRPVHATMVALLNLLDWAIGSIVFILVGFGLMFGDSAGGFIGTDLFSLIGLTDLSNTVSGPTFFIYQLAFAGTAITLVSGALVERISVLAYAIVAAAIGLVVYPVFGHWVWGNLLRPDNGAWLAELGFRDFAGGAVVHLVGATVALTGLVIIGPRIGRFGAKGEVHELGASNVGLTLLGVLMLWFSWWGFNGGSHLAVTGDVAGTILNTNLSGVFGVIGAGFWAYSFQGNYAANTKFVGGAVAGLVAITPGADIVGLNASMAIGLIAGIIYAVGHDFLLTLKVDDALGVIPAHGFASIWGLLALAIFAPSETFEHGRLVQVVIQGGGILVAIAWSFSSAFVIFKVVQRTVGLRISPTDELRGQDLEGGEDQDPIRRLRAKVQAHVASTQG